MGPVKKGKRNRMLGLAKAREAIKAKRLKTTNENTDMTSNHVGTPNPKISLTLSMVTQPEQCTNSPNQDPRSQVSGPRIIGLYSIDEMVRETSFHASTCKKGPVVLQSIDKLKQGITTKVYFACGCGKRFFMSSDDDKCSLDANTVLSSEHRASATADFLGCTTQTSALQDKLGHSQRFHCLLCFQMTNLSFNSSNVSKGADADFLVMFILRKMLDMPQEILQGYLKHGHPRKWISFCNQCQPVIMQAFQTQKYIETLEKRLRNFQQDMKTRINNSVISSSGKTSKIPVNRNSHVFSITNDIRKYVVTGLLPSSRAKNSGLQQQKAASHVHHFAPTKFEEVVFDLGYDLSEDNISCDNFVPDTEYSCKVNNSQTNEKKPKSSSSNKNSVAVTPSPVGRRSIAFKQNPLKELTFCCTECPTLLAMQSHSFAQHVLYHYDRPYKCSECGAFLTGSKLELEHHPEGVRRNPVTEPSHTCCLNSLVKIDYKLRKIWRCAHCQLRFDTVEDRSLHEQTIHHCIIPPVTLPCQCASCSKSFGSKDEWRVHRALEHPELAKLSCYHCDVTFKLKSKEGIEFLDAKKMRQHMQLHHVNLGCKLVCECDFCGANFTTETFLKHHIEQEHVVGSSSFVDLFACQICHVRWKSLANQQAHLRVSHSFEPKISSVCDVCGYETMEIWKFDEHRFLKHGIVPEKQKPILKCSTEDCSYQCLVRNNMEKHMVKMHGKERQHKCEECGNMFITTSDLTRHREIHKNAGVKPYQCEICGNSFALKNYLYIHMRLSHQNRPFASTHKKKPARNRKKVQQTPLEDEVPANSSSTSTTSLLPETQASPSETEDIDVTNRNIVDNNERPSNTSLEQLGNN